MNQLKSKKTPNIILGTSTAFQKDIVPVDNFYLQSALKLRGIPRETMLEIIGAEHIGKSTFVMWLLSQFMQAGCPCAYIETENKMMDDGRIEQAMHADRKMALRLRESLSVMQAFTVLEAIDKVHTWADSMRSEQFQSVTGLTLQTPLVIVIDTWSKLMPPSEAAGNYAYAEQEQKKKEKEIGTGTNFEHAKLAQAWCRILPSFLKQYNVILIPVSHQNDKVSMTAAPGASFMSAEVSALYNKTKIGGRAFNQNAAIQLIMARHQAIKNSGGDAIGHTVAVRVDKNSYGPNNRRFFFDIRTDDIFDENIQQPALVFDAHMAKFFADYKILGTKVDRKRFSCEALGVDKVEAEEFCRAFHANEQVKNKAGAIMRIRGYFCEDTDAEHVKVPAGISEDEEGDPESFDDESPEE